MAGTPGELVQMIESLHPRVKELESVLAEAKRSGESEPRDCAGVLEDARGIIAAIKDLQRQNDAAGGLQVSLEVELAETKRQLIEERDLRARLEGRVEALRAQAGRAGRSEEEFAVLEREQDQIARRLRDASAQLKLVAEERDRLAALKLHDETRIGELERNVMELQSQATRLEETAASAGRLRKELSETARALTAAQEESQRLKEEAQGLKNKADAMEVAKHTLGLELATTRGLVSGQDEQIDELTERLEAVRADLAAAQALVVRQGAENRKLIQSSERSEHELRALRARIESTQDELEASKQALREVRSVALRAAGRVLEPVPTT